MKNAGYIISFFGGALAGAAVAVICSHKCGQELRHAMHHILHDPHGGRCRCGSPYCKCDETGCHCESEKPQNAPMPQTDQTPQQ